MAREKITHERRHIRLRIEILDELLNSIVRRNYKELIGVLNKKLGEANEIGVEKRQLQYDIKYLIEEHEAPIHRPTKSDPCIYYTRKFSFKDQPLDDDEIASMKMAVAILKKATDIKLNAELDDIVAKLENKIYTNVIDDRTIIAFEEHTQANGREYFDEIFSAIHEKCPLKIKYQPFGKEEREWIIHPYMLKEYRNRWFLFGRESTTNKLHNLGLDRIKKPPKASSESFIENDLFNPSTYFSNLIGVTFPGEQEQPQGIFIKVKKKSC